MSGEIQAEANELGPLQGEYKADILETHGTAGTLGLLAAFAAAIFGCRLVIIDVQSQGIGALSDSFMELILFGSLLVYCLVGLFFAVMNITDRVLLYRDGLTFQSRFPRRYEVWRWEDVQRVEHSVTEDKKYRHKQHVYTLVSKDDRRLVLAALQNIAGLGSFIEEAVSQAKWAAARQWEPETVMRCGAGDGADQGWQVQEELLAVFDLKRFTREQVGQIRVSPDGRHVAVIDRAGEKSRVNLDRQTGESLQAVIADSLTFSPDGKRFAYIGGAPYLLFLFAGEERIGPYKGFIEGSPQFSPDSRCIAYAAQVRGGVRVCVDEGEIITAEKVGDALIFSPDSRSIAFKAMLGGKQCIVHDGQIGPFYDHVDNPHFSPDSQHLAYAARQDDEWFLVVDGVQGPRHGDAAEPLFSPDSSRLTYYARGQDGYYLMVDGIPCGPYDALGQSPFGRCRFSPDSRRIAYVVREEERPRSKSPFKETVVVDGQPDSPYQRCGHLVFSANSARLGYLAYRSKKYYVVIDGEPYGPFDDIRDDSPAFSPHGKTFAFSAYELGVCQVMINGQLLGSYRLAFTPVFGPDGRHHAFGAYASDGCQVVIDGAPGKRYEALLRAGQPGVVFDAPDRLHYIASSQEAPDHWLLVTERERSGAEITTAKQNLVTSKRPA